MAAGASRKCGQVGRLRPEQAVQQPAQMRIAHGGDQVAQLALHRRGAARRAVDQVGQIEAALGRAAQRAHGDLRAVARVVVEAADDAHRHVRAHVRLQLAHAVPDHRADHAAAIPEVELEELAAVTLAAHLDAPHQQDLVDVASVGELTHEHAGNVETPADETPGTGVVCAISMAATAIVTGGTGGLGHAVTERFLADGWRVVVPWVAERELERVGTHEGLELIQADLFDEASVAEVVALAAHDDTRPLQAVVNLVGGFGQGGRIHETPIADFESQLRLNLRPTYLVTAAALPHLVAAQHGSIVCVSTRAALRPFPGAAGYVTAKAAVLAFVDAAAVEYKKDRVRVNAVLPSIIDTPANRAANPDGNFDNWVQPREIADVIAFLCSDAAAVTSGAHVPVYGRA